MDNEQEPSQERKCVDETTNLDGTNYNVKYEGFRPARRTCRLTNRQRVRSSEEDHTYSTQEIVVLTVSEFRFNRKCVYIMKLFVE